MNVTGSLSGLMGFLRALGVPGLGGLKQAGLQTLKSALRAAMEMEGARLQAVALHRIAGDGDVERLVQPGPFVDKDGVRMTGRQWFVHQALYAIPRVVMGGEPADLIRDDHFAAWGLAEAETLLAGVTDGAEAVRRVWERFLKQLT
ncbi:MAG TPA: hypothetical protein VFU47_13415 [Armatimonadota bacterium]|nr:hypothetical protein [Armatimonadota bacterium]